MKIRKGFVSNSSSSSFVCDVCGHDESGWDLCLSDAEMTECRNGHVFCDSHIEGGLSEVSLEDKKKAVLEYLGDDPDVEDTIEEVNNDDEDIIDEIYEEYLTESDVRYEWPPEKCPCCCLTSPMDGQVLTYVLYVLGKTRKEVEQEMRDKFGNWDTLFKAIRAGQK